MLDFASARATYEKDRPWYESKGIYHTGGRMYLPDAVRQNYKLAFDALPTLTTDPNSAVPAMAD